MQLNVVGHNYVSPENLHNPLIPTDVECAAFDENGDWLVTFERRDDGLTAIESRLKFWLYSTERNRFEWHHTPRPMYKMATVAWKSLKLLSLFFPEWVSRVGPKKSLKMELRLESC